MTDEAWQGIRERVLRLRGRSGVFGGLAHGFALAPPLPDADLDEAERSLGVRLPEPYRSFLLTVGAGGAGPAYGLVTLARTDGGWGWDAEDTTRLGEPFAPTHIGGVAIDPLVLRPPAQYDFEYHDDYVTARRRWEATMWHPDRTAGALRLGDEGCDRRTWLVVTGDERGTIWRDYRVDGVDLTPLFDREGHRVSFADWYLTWLTEAERLEAGAGKASHPAGTRNVLEADG